MFVGYAAHPDFLLLLALTAVIFGGLASWLHRTGALPHFPQLSWAAVALLLVAGWFWTEAAEGRARARVREQVAHLLPTYAEEFQRLGHARLDTARLAPDDPLYLQLIELQKRWLLLNPFIADIYTFRRTPDGRTVLLVDSETDYDRNGRYDGEREQRTPPGEPFTQEIPELAQAFAGRGAFRELPYTDRWGSWVSSFEPLRDEAGRVEAVIGVDFDAAQWTDAIGRARLLAIIPTGVLLGVTALAGGLLAGARADLARRAVSERQLREQGAMLRTVLAGAPVILFAIDRRGTITLSEGAGLRALGRQPGESVGQDFFALYADEPAILAHLRQALGGETIAARHDRHGHTFEIQVAPTRDDAGTVTGVIGVALDVTAHVQALRERSALERRLLDTQKLESLGVLAGGVAHDFNNLLTAILGNAALARLALEPAGRAGVHLDRIEHASQTAAALCRQLLVFSGGGQMDPGSVDLSTTVEETIALLKVSLGENTRLDLALARDLPTVRADAAQLRQIVLNLVLNAAQAIGDRPGMISVRTVARTVDAAWLAGTRVGEDSAPGPRVCLVVADNGPGMEPAVLARIFDPFFTTKSTGRGLGLASVLGIVRGHGGALHVHSEPGLGTTFTVALQPETTAPERRPVMNTSAADWRGSGSILVVDDEEPVRRTAAQMVERFGFRVSEANSGAAALALVDAGQEFTLVLLDAVMPGMDGAETLAELRRRRPSQRVVVFSGYRPQDMRTRFDSQIPFGFLQKPFSPESLRDALRNALEN